MNYVYFVILFEEVFHLLDEQRIDNFLQGVNEYN